MKKILVLLLILVAIGGATFYFGWIQIQLPEYTYAVIFTKTRGWDESVTEPGRFTWRWERLVPKNLKILKYTIEPQNATFRYNGQLPSGDLYSQLIEPRPDFDYSVAFSLSYTLNPEALPEIASVQMISPDSMDLYYDRLTTSISAQAATIVNSLARSEEFTVTLAVASPEIESMLINRLQPQFREVTIHRILPTTLELPDVELYHAAKAQFLKIAASREASRVRIMDDVVKTDIRVNQHFDVLERYGELLAKYPVLLDLIELKEGRLDTILEEIERIEIELDQL